MGYVCTLSKELQEQAKKELNEDPDRREQDIEHIRKWIKKQPHLNIRTDDAFILRFLRGCKFSLERTKEKIDMHYTLKQLAPEWFKNRDPQDTRLREILKLGIMLPLKDKDDEGRNVMVMRQGICDPKEYSGDDLMKVVYMFVDVVYEEDEDIQITGGLSVMDLEGMTIAHMLQYPMSSVKKSMVIWQDGYAVRNKGMNFVNAPSSFVGIFNTFKIFFNDKNRNRLKIYDSNYEELFNEIPKRILPKEYGGEGETVEQITDRWLKIIDSRRQWLIDDQKNTVDESKRPGKPKRSEDLFGIDGSFRKLNVD